MRLIDADALERDMRQYADRKCANGEIELANGILKSIGRIKDAPAIDTVRHGRWEYSRTQSEFAVHRCSVCGKEQFAISNVVAEGNYCPSCGARMDGDAHHVKDL